MTCMRRRVVLAGALLGAWGSSAQQVSQPVISTLPVGSGAVAIGDLNRDGKPDIAAAHANAVTIYLGDGRGRFERAAGSPFAAGNNPSDLAPGDFNEDGRLDIAIANHETDYLTLLLGDGRGALAPPLHLPVASRPHPHGVAAGDFNGDRHLDLAVESWQQDAVLVLHGNGTAEFASAPQR